MRLLNTTTRRLEIFADGKARPDAILSHTWGDEEVLFQHLQHSAIATPTEITELAGYEKIRGFCVQAASDGLEYVWIDTCCIDKTSSAELSEAVNSMYEWYKRARVCYVYLADVPSDGNHESKRSLFSKSRWFTRGWTLQELLAPAEVIIYGNDWIEIGTKRSMSKLISVVTGIDLQFLFTSGKGKASVATKMSWVAKRKTTRVEDVAYCMMGIFAVNMPVIYGEVETAFMRLQYEIIRLSDDHSIFAWTDPQPLWHKLKIQRGLLASSPSSFADSGLVHPFDYNVQKSPFQLTNLGLQIQLPLLPCENDETLFLVTLNCQLAERRPLQIYLRKLSPKKYTRTQTHLIKMGCLDSTTRSKVTEFHVSQDYFSSFGRPRQREVFNIDVKSLPSPENGFRVDELYPSEDWSDVNGLPGCLIRLGSFSGLKFRNKEGTGFAVLIRKDAYSQWIEIVTNIGHESMADLCDAYDRASEADQGQTHRSDRISKTISTGMLLAEVSASIKESFLHDGPSYIVDIKMNTVTPGQLEPVVPLQQNRYHLIAVKLTCTKPWQRVHGFRDLPGWPDRIRSSIRLPDSGMCGVLYFEAPLYGLGGLAVVAGVEQSRIWFDVLSDPGKETMEEVAASYFGEQPRRTKKWRCEEAVATFSETGTLARVIYRTPCSASGFRFSMRSKDGGHFQQFM